METAPSMAATLLMADNTVEIIRTSSVRRLLLTPNDQHILIVTDEVNQAVLYLLDTEDFAKHFAFVEADPDQVGDGVSRDRLAKAVFAAVINGATFHVTAKQTPPSPFVAVA